MSSRIDVLKCLPESFKPHWKPIVLIFSPSYIILTAMIIKGDLFSITLGLALSIFHYIFMAYLLKIDFTMRFRRENTRIVVTSKLPGLNRVIELRKARKIYFTQTRYRLCLNFMSENGIYLGYVPLDYFRFETLEAWSKEHLEVINY